MREIITCQDTKTINDLNENIELVNSNHSQECNVNLSGKEKVHPAGAPGAIAKVIEELKECNDVEGRERQLIAKQILQGVLGDWDSLQWIIIPTKNKTLKDFVKEKIEEIKKQLEELER